MDNDSNKNIVGQYSNRIGKQFVIGVFGPYDKRDCVKTYWMKMICLQTEFCWDYFMNNKSDIIHHLITIHNELETLCFNIHTIYLIKINIYNEI